MPCGRPGAAPTPSPGRPRSRPASPGQWFQIESALHYNWHRHYDPTLGRYTQPDPLGFVDGPSIYGYVKARPQQLVDPEGLDVSVCLYGDAAGGLGHLGFGLPDRGEQGTHGYYPKGNGSSGPGIVKKDEQKSAQCKRLTSSPEQDDCMARCRDDRRQNPGVYGLVTNNCAQFVRFCLNKCGVGNNLPTTPFPNKLYQSLPQG